MYIEIEFDTDFIVSGDFTEVELYETVKDNEVVEVYGWVRTYTWDEVVERYEDWGNDDLSFLDGDE